MIFSYLRDEPKNISGAENYNALKNSIRPCIYYERLDLAHPERRFDANRSLGMLRTDSWKK